MRWVLLSAGALLASTPDGGVAPHVAVRAMVEEVHHPCTGGVAVTPEMIERQTQRIPFVNRALTLYAGRERRGNPAARVTTDGSGHFRVSLAPGTYCASSLKEPPPSITPDGPDAPNLGTAPANSMYDAECMRELPFRCEAEFEVSRAGEVKIELSRRCEAQYAHPCWRGPMPP